MHDETQYTMKLRIAFTESFFRDHIAHSSFKILS